MSVPVVLLDIDGTLLHGGGLWKECIDESLREVFPGVAFPPVSFSGKTDRQIMSEFLHAAGLAPALRSGETPPEAHAEFREPVARAIEGYIARAQARLRGGACEVRLLPGVGVLGHFHPELPGAFGDDHWDRYALPEIARVFFERRGGTPVRGADLVIVGDTEHDVLCGRSIGARAIAVGTGSPAQRAPLLAARPDWFFENLTDAAAFERAILG